jgi:putative sigma-54 modulation protein
MKINLKSTNMELTAAIKDYVNDKLSGLDKYFDNMQQVDVEVGKTTNGQNKGDLFFCEVNVSVPRSLLRYRDNTDDLYKSINNAKKGIKIEIGKYKEKLRDNR